MIFESAIADGAGAPVAPKGRRWAGWLAPYGDRQMLLILLLGFASGLPLLLTFSTLTARMAAEHINRAEIGLAALFGLPYALKFVWAPVIDRTPPPLPLGRRRGWGVAIQLALIAAIVALGACDPRRSLRATALLALLVAFLSASQDIVIDAWRVEILTPEQQGPGAGMIQTGYRIGMLAAGAGALFIADRAGWFTSYAVIAGLLGVGLGAFLIAPEPPEPLRPRAPGTSRRQAMTDWFTGAIAGPLADFTRHRRWIWILLFVVTYKIGEALAGVMAMPLYIAIGYSLSEIAAISKVAGFFATIAGALIGGIVTARWGLFRALLICGLLQSAGNLFYVLQAVGGYRLDYLMLCVAAENVTSAMAGAAFIAYLSELCSPAFTATQYALLSSLSAVGRSVIGSTAGVLAERLGWAHFFLLATAATLPALVILMIVMSGGAATERNAASQLA